MSLGNESGGSRGGSSSDSLIGRLVVERGLAPQAEVDAAFAAMRTGTDQQRAFVDVLVEAQIITRRQLSRLRTEAEGDRTVLRIPGYQIMRKLGAGAMASVYLAKQTSLDRLVAIKILPRRYSSDTAFIERFYKEGRAAAKLSDPNIVGAFDVGQVGDQHYFVMEYVEGETVYDRITRFKKLKDRDALVITRQVASALKHAHARGFIHRDIKPKNIMITKSNVVKLADLGLARAIADKKSAEAERNKAFGTPYYISPEQIRGSVDLGPPADIYGLGATLFHMLTGRVPFEGKDPTEVMQRHLRQELTPPDQVASGISQGTAEIVEMMMMKAPRDRYQTADELLEDLDLAIAGEPLRYASRGVDLAGIATDVEGTAESEVQSGARDKHGIPPVAIAAIVGLACVCVLLALLLALK
ncbi:MAG: serine/threonine protein kinase [Phycisphaerales bacterium]|nr:serine/threonine protein kinase [Phycisphaerales bacterium]